MTSNRKKEDSPKVLHPMAWANGGVSTSNTPPASSAGTSWPTALESPVAVHHAPLLRAGRALTGQAPPWVRWWEGAWLGSVGSMMMVLNLMVKAGSNLSCEINRKFTSICFGQNTV